MPIIICCTPDSNNGYLYGNVLIQAIKYRVKFTQKIEFVFINKR